MQVDTAPTYATHIPVLRALSTLLPMTRVIEFGGGDHSTSFFLDLPQLQELVTVETDEGWAARLAEVHGGDPRFVLRRRASAVGFDFCLIDDGHVDVERAATIGRVLHAKHPPTLIHDTEVLAYRDLIDQLGANAIHFREERPWSSLVWR